MHCLLHLILHGQGVNIHFINNTARLSGAAIYASDMQRCSWLGNDHADLENTVIFKPPANINLRTPFKFEVGGHILCACI